SCMIDETVNSCLVGTAYQTTFCDDDSGINDWTNCSEHDQYTVSWYYDDLSKIRREKRHELSGHIDGEVWYRQ
ncbi:MAG: hypothetical protein VYC54_08835, partial [Pseudomonadota bacterium]|nr:hypothetical protein [Pseudomonadota bacterium]